jgi:uncharacterized membrane protein
MSHKKRDIKKAERRKLEFEQREKKTKNIAIAIVVVVAIISIGVFYVISTAGNENISNNKTTQSTMPQSDTEIRIPVASITTEAEFYSHESDDGEIRFFTVIGSDDEIHVALDACDVCYHAKKGYEQAGNEMRCINCGLKFAINGIGSENKGGGCWPSYIPINIDGDDIVIQISDLEEKSYMFK